MYIQNLQIKQKKIEYRWCPKSFYYKLPYMYICLVKAFGWFSNKMTSWFIDPSCPGFVKYWCAFEKKVHCFSVEKNGWKISAQKCAEGDKSTEEKIVYNCKFLAIATGHHAKPKIVTFPGQDSFTGKKNVDFLLGVTLSFSTYNLQPMRTLSESPKKLCFQTFLETKTWFCSDFFFFFFK